MEYESPLYITGAAIKSLTSKLNLPTLEPFRQDWELEITDSSRVLEFIMFYEKQVLNENERFALMALIIASYDDYLSGGNVPDLVWTKIKYFLLKHFAIHKNKIIYWALEEENDIENCFAITPLMREVLEQVNADRNNNK